jgi:outer membrane lipoprotein SlyB
MEKTVSAVVVVAALALAGCAGSGHRSDDTQAFLGISQDIEATFSTQTDYMSPLRPGQFGRY